MKIQFICWFTIIKKQAFPQKPAFLKNPDCQEIIYKR